MILLLIISSVYKEAFGPEKSRGCVLGTDISGCGGRGDTETTIIPTPLLNADILLPLDFARPEKPDESSPVFRSFTFILFICKCPFRPLLYSFNMGIKCNNRDENISYFHSHWWFLKALHCGEAFSFNCARIYKQLRLSSVFFSLVRCLCMSVRATLTGMCIIVRRDLMSSSGLQERFLSPKYSRLKKWFSCRLTG